MTDVLCKHIRISLVCRAAARISLETVYLVKRCLLKPIVSHAAGNFSTEKNTLFLCNPYFYPRYKYKEQMQNLALTGSVVLGNRQIYQLFDQFERAFWQISRVFWGTTLGLKIVLAELKTRFYNSVLSQLCSQQLGRSCPVGLGTSSRILWGSSAVFFLSRNFAVTYTVFGYFWVNLSDFQHFWVYFGHFWANFEHFLTAFISRFLVNGSDSR